MKQKSILFMTLLVFVGNLFGQECLDLNYKLRGYFYAGTSQVDKEAFGGFYEDENKPKPFPDNLESISQAGQFQLVVQPDSISQFFSWI